VTTDEFPGAVLVGTKTQALELERETADVVILKAWSIS
jgi:hypothetical protein